MTLGMLDKGSKWIVASSVHDLHVLSDVVDGCFLNLRELRTDMDQGIDNLAVVDGVDEVLLALGSKVVDLVQVGGEQQVTPLDRLEVPG